MYYNTLRSTSKDNKLTNTKERLVGTNKREKLKSLLLTKFMKKFGLEAPGHILERELNQFLQNEKLSDSDLKKLDERLTHLLAEKQSEDTLKHNLQNVTDAHSYTNVKLPDIETMSVKSKHSKMSGASNLSKFNERGVNYNPIPAEEHFEALEFAAHKPVERLDFSSQGDEWNAIAVYNQQMFEEEKLTNKLKDKEVKRRTKEDLDNQVRHKLRKHNEHELQTMEQDLQVLQHLEYLNKLELEKQAEYKRKVLVEKDSRDKQLKDEKTRKKIEIKKEKKYEKELVKAIVTDMEREKQIFIKKKIEEKEALKKTLKDNELNKVKALEQFKKERAEDIQIMEEYAQVLDKQERDRAEYFKRIERNANNFMSMMAGTVLKEQNDRNKAEEGMMNKYLADKERR
jgi:hypothetical protein